MFGGQTREEEEVRNSPPPVFVSLFEEIGPICPEVVRSEPVHLLSQVQQQQHVRFCLLNMKNILTFIDP